MELPKVFADQMRNWLVTEWPDFRDALTEPAQRAVRLHRLTSQCHPEAGYGTGAHHGRQVLADPGMLTVPYAIAMAPRPAPASVRAALGDAVPWQPEAFYISPDSTLGKHLYHELGAWYLQEPSAMAPVAALDPRPGERILDLCAAPGGKTTAIAQRLHGDGLLVANEIHPARVVTLSQNLERLGIPAVITNETPEALAAAWPEQFDAVLVDAPCSGEGMFRKEPEAMDQWHADLAETCMLRQRHILEHAVRLVQPGGRILYSTCTFNPFENEQVVAWALHHLPVEIRPLPTWPGWTSGRPDWADDGAALLETRRLWPHQARGEGHFMAAFTVTSHAAVPDTRRDQVPSRRANHGRTGGGTAAFPHLSGPELAQWTRWLAAATTVEWTPWQRPRQSSRHLFAAASADLPLDGLKVLRPGICLAVMEQDRFIPHHQWAMALSAQSPSSAGALSAGEASRYVAGESLVPVGPAGWTWLHTDGLPVGWGKTVSDRINNAYPKGLRKADLFLP